MALFVAVGCVAAIVHWGVAVFLVRGGSLGPLVANAVGWLVAFGVSFAGQSTWTFRGHGAPFWRTVGRYFLLSGGGFVINETTYALLLRWSAVRYDFLLAAVLLCVAGLSFVLSRVWAFRPNRRTSSR